MNMKQRDFTSAKAREVLLKDNAGHCGECCWFYAEDTYGYGMCPFRFAETHECGQQCEVPLKYVSKKEMRHHMAVLLQQHRVVENPSIRFSTGVKDLWEAQDFAYRYIKVFSNL